MGRPPSSTGAHWCPVSWTGPCLCPVPLLGWVVLGMAPVAGSDMARSCRTVVVGALIGDFLHPFLVSHVPPSGGLFWHRHMELLGQGSQFGLAACRGLCGVIQVRAFVVEVRTMAWMS